MFGSDLERRHRRGANTEVEVRFRAVDPGRIADALRLDGAVIGVSELIADHWYAPLHVVDLESHEKWLADAQLAPLRVRERTVDGRTVTSLEVKRPVVTAAYEVNEEAAVVLGTLEDGVRFAETLGYRRLVTLEKRRRTWRLRSAAVSLDAYTGRGHVLEIEAASHGGSVESLVELATRLGVDLVDRMEASSALTFIREELQHLRVERPL